MTIGCEKTLPSSRSSAGEDFSEKVLKNSKLLLSGSFTELKANSFAESHSVELYLTTCGELLVLKKTSEKPHGHSLVRRHNLKSTVFTQHPQIANAMQAEVPSTVLRYVYRLENPDSTVVSVREWIAELQRNKDSVHLPAATHSQLNGECSSKAECCSRLKESTNYCPQGVVNGFTHAMATTLNKPNCSYKLTSPTSPVAQKRAFPLENLISESDLRGSQMVEVEPPFIQLAAANNNYAEAAVVEQIDERDNASGDSNSGLSQFQDELDVLKMTKDHRGSLRLDFQTARHKILRSASDRLLGERMPFCKDVEDQEEDVQRKTSVSTSELSNMKSPTVCPEGLCTVTCGVNPRTHCSTDKSEFLSSKFRHMQIRNRKWKYSPRFSRSTSYQHKPSDSNVSEDQFISRSTSTSPASGSSSHLSEAPRSIRTEVEPPELVSSSTTNSQASTLPRAKKGDLKHLHSAGSHGKTAPGSPMLSNKFASKSPRLLRMFHRRWQSSSAIKVPLNLDESTMSYDSQSSSVPGDGLTPHHAAPKKLYQYSSKEVAEELTLIDAELIRGIGPEEVQNEAWMKKETKDQIAPNVMTMVRAFNQLALLVPSEILEETTPQARAKVITAYIQIASKCYRLRNYNSLKAILAGLQCTPIFRLKSSWKEVSSKKRKRFDQLSAFMSECDNWQLYQGEIERLTSLGTSFIPFLGQFLTKLVHQKSYQQIKAEKRAKKSPPTSTSSANKNSDLELSSSVAGDPSDIHPRSSVCKEVQSVSSPPSSISSSDDETNRGMNVTPGKDGFQIETPSVLIRKPSITTSEDSVDSRFNLADYLSRRRFTDQAHSAYVRTPVSPEGVVDSTEQEIEDTPGSVYKANFLSPVTTPTHRRLEFEELHGDDIIDGESDSGLHSSIDCRSSSIPRSSSQGSFTMEHDVELRRDHSSSVNDGLELSHIYFKLKRRSRSYESLLDAYTDDDPGLKSVLHSTLAELARLSSSLESLDSISDDELSCDVSSISLDINASGNQDLSASFMSNSSVVTYEVQDTVISELSDTIRRVSLKNDTEEKKSEDHEEEDLRTTSELLDREVHVGNGKKSDKKKRPVRRSKSYSNSGVTKKFLRRKRYGRHNSTNKPSDENESTSKEVLEPHEALNKYQVASLGCSIGIETRTVLRSLIRDASPNTEKENYSLSVTREV